MLSRIRRMPHLGKTLLFLLLCAGCTLGLNDEEPPKFLSNVSHPVTELQVPTRLRTDPGEGSKWWKLSANEGEMVVILLNPRNSSGNDSDCRNEFLELFDQSNDSLMLIGGKQCGEDDKIMYSSGSQIVLHVVSESMLSYDVIAFGQADNPEYVGYMFDGQIQESSEELKVYIATDIRIPTDGLIEAWEIKMTDYVSVDTEDTFKMAVFRPRPSSTEDGDENFIIVHLFQPDYTYCFLGTRSVIPVKEPLAVQRGDRIGFVVSRRIPIEGGVTTTQKQWLVYYVSASNESQVQEGMILSGPYSLLNYLFAIGVKLSRGKSCALKGPAGDFDGALVGDKCGQVAGFVLPKYHFQPSTYYWRLNARQENVVLKTLLYSDNLYITNSVLQLRDFPDTLSISPGEYEIHQEGNLKQFIIDVHFCDCRCEFNSSRGEVLVPLRDASTTFRAESNSEGCKMTVGLVEKSDDTPRYHFLVRVGGGVKQKIGNDCLGLVHVRERVRSYKRTIKELCYDGSSQDVVYIVTTSTAPFEIETMPYVSRGANITTSAVRLEYQEQVLELRECTDSMELNIPNPPYGTNSEHDEINFRTKLTESECTVHIKADQGFNFSLTVDIYHGDFCLDYIRVISVNGSTLFDSCKDAGVRHKEFPMMTKEVILKFLTDGHEKDANISMHYTWLGLNDSSLTVLKSEEMNGVVVFEKWPRQVHKRKVLRLEFHPASNDPVFLFVNELRACEPIEILVRDRSEVKLKTFVQSNLTTGCFATSLPGRLDLPAFGGTVELTYWRNFSLRATFHTNVSFMMCGGNSMYLTYPGSGFCYGPAATTVNVYNGWPSDANSLCQKGLQLGELQDLRDLPEGFLENFKLPKNTSLLFRDSVRKTIRILPYDILTGRSESIPVSEPNVFLTTEAWTPLCMLDIDECSLGDVRCSQRCVNEIGSYRCACDNGQYLQRNKVDCKGICEAVSDGLETKDGYCVLAEEQCEYNSTGQNSECAEPYNAKHDPKLLEKMTGNMSTLNQSGILTSTYGYITSPLFPLYTPLESGYWWEISTQKPIRLTVVKYAVTGSSRHPLFVYDWSLPQRYVINQVSSPTDVHPIFSAGSSLSITLSSTGSRSKIFILQMEYIPQVCRFGGDCRDGSRCRRSGVVSAEGTKFVHTKHRWLCMWHIKAPDRRQVMLSPHVDQLQIFDGLKTYGLRRLLPKRYSLLLSTASVLTVFYPAWFEDSIRTVFRVEFGESGCGGCVQVDEPVYTKKTYKCMGLQCGYIISPNYAGMPEQSAEWYITVDRNKTVELSFEDFEPDQTARRCSFDRSVRIYRSVKTTAYTDVCGTANPRSKHASIGNIMKLTLDSRSVKFRGKYEAVSLSDITELDSHNFSDICGQDWVAHGDHCYRFYSNNVISWQAARSSCQGHSADLVSILNEEEMFFVFNYFLEVVEEPEPWFIGLTDPSRKNRFKWSDGNPPSYLDWTDYRVSGTPQPQPSTTGDEDCVMFNTSHFSSTNQWIKVSCDEDVAKSYICKRKQKGQTVNDKAKTNSFSDCNPGWIQIDLRCFRLVSVPPKNRNKYSFFGANEGTDQYFLRYRELHKEFTGIYPQVIDLGGAWIYGSKNSMECFIYHRLVEWVDICVHLRDGQRAFMILERPLLSSYGDHALIKKHLFPCGNGEYVLVTERCDGHKDCPDGTEEIDCELPRLGANKFICEDGMLISAHRVCDFHPDCQDGADEYCVHDSCSETDEFSCRNGQCIPREKYCNTFRDCRDGSDEEACYACSSKDSSSTFLCHDGTSISKKLYCNGQVDCPGTDYEDEPGLRSVDDAKKCEYMKGCAIDQIRCENGFCAHLSSRCLFEFSEHAGQFGCQDMTHLRHCQSFKCPVGYVKCPRSYCIPLRYMCNGQWDCPYGVDETNCTDLRCPGEYRCKQSQQCISLRYNRCDGVKDCPLGDDEELCDLVCPENCSCEGTSLDCSGLSLTDLPGGLQSSVRSLNLSRNILSVDSVNFDSLTLLGALDLSNNNFTYLPRGLFDGLRNLYYLNLRNNALRSLSDTFDRLHLLRYVLLTNCGTIKTLTANIFNSSFVVNLDLSGLGVEVIEDGAFNGLPKLSKLAIQNNDISTYSRQMFKGIRRLETLFSDNYAFCCILREESDAGEHCTPEEDHLSSCSDLMAHLSFRVFLWVFGLLAFLGNLGVIILRLVTKETNQVHSLMIGNLAVADGLMGVYMVIIAAVDTYYRGKYIEVADKWKTSALCQVSGIIATMSSEVSVFTLTLITLDRFINVVFPLRAWRIRVPMAKKVIAAIWTIVAAISVVPVLPIDYFGGKFYARSGVCLPFQLTQGRPSGWEYSTAVFIVLNTVSCLAIFLGYLVMYRVVRRTGRAIRATADKQRVKREMALARRMMLIVSTDLFCWIPIIATGLLSLFSNVKIHGIVYAVMAVFVLPVNSALNPVLYTYSTIQFRKSKKNYDEAVKGRTMSAPSTVATQTKAVSTNTTASVLGLSQKWADNNVVTLDVTRVSSLTQCLEEGWEFLPEQLLAVSRDITAALTYLHQSNLCHGAVCADNILIYKDDKLGKFRAYLAGTTSLSVVDDPDIQEMSALDRSDLKMVLDMVAGQQEHTNEQQTTNVFNPF